jgi:hypothetical protein
MDVRIVRSVRRVRTVSGSVREGRLIVRAPEGLCEKDLCLIIARFQKRFEQKQLKDDLNKRENLFETASRLNAKYFDNVLYVKSIEYVANQQSKYGCCDYRNGVIRISHKVSSMPQWVREYVVLHEMAHLIEPHHGRSFWDIVNRYRLTERARGYLIAAGSFPAPSGSDIKQKEG